MGDMPQHLYSAQQPPVPPPPPVVASRSYTDAWVKFLNSFDSDGAHMLTLSAFTIGIGGLVWYVSSHNVTASIATAVLTTFSMFSGGLLQRIKSPSSGSPQPPPITQDKTNG